jgi:Holliday junction resolvase
MRENPRVKKAIDLINALPRTKAIKIHGSSEQERGTPDILVNSQNESLGNSVFTVVEMKTEKGKLSKIQIRRLTEWAETGAKIIVSTDPDEVAYLVVCYKSNWSPYEFQAGSFTISDR